MSNHPKWLLHAYREWGDQILSEDIGDWKLSKLTGWTRHKCRKVIHFTRQMDSMGPDPDSPADDVTEEEEPVEPVKIKASESQDWLWQDNYVYNADTDTYITFTKSTGKPMVMPGHKHRAIVEAYSNWDGRPSTINMICRQFSIPRPWLIEYLRLHGITHDSEPFSREEVQERSVGDMVEEAIQAKRQALYQEYEKRKWKDTKDKAEKWMAFEEVVLGRLVESISEHASPNREVPKLQMEQADHNFSLVVSPTDFHWGMYSWDGEVGFKESYDQQKAEERLFRHTENVLGRLPGQPDKIIVAVGSDFFHIDGQKHTTTKGTPMDTHGTPTEILVTGCHLVRSHIDLLRQVAPVEVWMMAGNHDQHNSRALLLFLAAWYRETNDVTVHQDFRSRVYTQYGNTLIGFSHGDGTPVRDLGACMAKEARKKWAKTEHHIFFGGHLHHHKVHEVGGITHYMLPSLAGIDRWHHHEGYVTSDPALVVYLIDEEEGPFSWIQSKE